MRYIKQRDIPIQDRHTHTQTHPHTHRQTQSDRNTHTETHPQSPTNTHSHSFLDTFPIPILMHMTVISSGNANCKDIQQQHGTQRNVSCSIFVETTSLLLTSEGKINLCEGVEPSRLSWTTWRTCEIISFCVYRRRLGQVRLEKVVEFILNIRNIFFFSFFSLSRLGHHSPRFLISRGGN